MELIILTSAHKHGVAEEDILHACRNPLATSKEDDLTMIVGPARNADLLEIGVVAARDFQGLVVVHAMAARLRYLR